jgi:hypothetical protein
MDQSDDGGTLKAMAAEAFGALRNTRQIPPFSGRPGGLGVEGSLSRHAAGQADVRG